MSNPPPTRYRTTNWPEYNAALRRRGSLLVWLDREMGWLAPASGRPGRPETFSDAAIQVCLTIKVLLWLPPVRPEVSDLVGVGSSAVFCQASRCGTDRPRAGMVICGSGPDLFAELICS